MPSIPLYQLWAAMPTVPGWAHSAERTVTHRAPLPVLGAGIEHVARGRLVAVAAQHESGTQQACS